MCEEYLELFGLLMASDVIIRGYIYMEDTILIGKKVCLEGYSEMHTYIYSRTTHTSNK